MLETSCRERLRSRPQKEAFLATLEEAGSWRWARTNENGEMLHDLLGDEFRQAPVGEPVVDQELHGMISSSRNRGLQRRSG